MIYFTSDEHYYHHNILRYSNRPFSSLSEMHDILLENHNKIVKNTDVTFHLGDYTFEKDCDKVHNFIKKFNGNHVFITGSHDYWQKEYSRKYKENFRDIREVKYNDITIVICHYCMTSWPKSHYGSWHLFGHHHGNMTYNVGKSYDIGVDCNNFRPISFDEIVEIMKNRPGNNENYSKK